MTTPTCTPIEYAQIELRRERDRLLAESDWLVIRSIESGQPMPSEWAAYRQALRNLPQNVNIELNRFDLIDWSKIVMPQKP